MHPKERQPGLGETTRRELLERAGGLALGLSGMAGLVAGCSNTPSSAAGGSSGSPAETGPRGIPLGRPGQPATMPIYADNKAIASGLAPESGATLQVYNWTAYLNAAVVKAFEKKYNCNVQVSTFTTAGESVSKITAKTTQFDVYFPTIDELPNLVAGELIQPLNPAYIPNLSKNIWPALQSPWYDAHARYTVPYTIWTTGIAWRNDKMPSFNPDAMANPYDIFWQSTNIAGKVALLDDPGSAMGMTLLRNHITDLNTTNPKHLALVEKQLLNLVKTTNCKFDVTDYTDLPNGTTWLHQAWSGDIIAVPAYMPKGLSPSVISYWFPKNHRGMLGNDTIAVLKGANSPVLAHLFLNHMLDYDQALLNMAYTGYQQPQVLENPSHLVAEKLVNPAQSSCIAYEADFKQGYQEGANTVAGRQAQQNTWSAIKAGG